MYEPYRDLLQGGPMFLTPCKDASVRECEARVHRLAEIFTAEQLDAAMDRAGRSAQAVVAAFAAAPTDCSVIGESANGVSAAIEFAIEFLVPPCSLDLFHRELEAQLLRDSVQYVASRYRGEFAPCMVHEIPAGAFHQHRLVWRFAAERQSSLPWSRGRELVDGVLRLARLGRRGLCA